MHRLTVRNELIREVMTDLMAVGFSPQQVKALIITIKKIHDDRPPETERADGNNSRPVPIV